jgi:PEP-CTERM motif
MFKSRIAVLALGLCAAAFLPSVAKADSITYNFSYTGTGTDISGETASGNGSLTINYTTALSSGVLTAFNFTDTLTLPGGNSSTFIYGINDVISNSIVLGGTLANPNIQFGTSEVHGSNNDFFKSAFNLTYTGTNPGLGNTVGDGNSQEHQNDFTDGHTTLVDPPPAVPEPATYALMATGLFGLAFFVRGNRLANHA